MTDTIFKNSDQTKTAWEASQFFGNAQELQSRHDRWIVANQFFQMFNSIIGRSSSAILANDWSSFGYKTWSLPECVAREIAAQTARRAR